MTTEENTEKIQKRKKYTGREADMHNEHRHTSASGYREWLTQPKEKQRAEEIIPLTKQMAQ